MAATYKKLLAVVRDFKLIKSDLQRMIKEVCQTKDNVAQNFYNEGIDFLEFLKKDYFIYLSCCVFNAKKVNGEKNICD